MFLIIIILNRSIFTRELCATSQEGLERENSPMQVLGAVQLGVSVGTSQLQQD